MKPSWRVDPYLLLGFFSILIIGGSLTFQRKPVAASPPLPEVPAELFLTLDSLGVGRLVGDSRAPVRVATLSDYACEGCAVAEVHLRPRLVEWLESGLVHLVVYETPIPVHPHSEVAAAVAGCAYQQGATLYFAVRELVFERREEWLATESPVEVLTAIAEAAGSDGEPLRECLRATGRERALSARRGWMAARTAGVTFVPLWFVDGTAVPWPVLHEEVRGARLR
jgi:protein-disulfide isomerase